MDSNPYLLARSIHWWAALLVAAGLAGCEVTSEKIQTWKASEKGPAKIRYAVRDTRQKLAVRAEAIEALGELGFFAPLSDDLKSLGAADRKQLIDKVSQNLVARMRGSNPRATGKVQLQAKDTLFTIREYADSEQRRVIDDEVVRWLLADWRNRKDGENSGDKIVRTIGSQAGSLLAAELTSVPSNILTLVTLLREVGEPSARDAGAEKLVSFAKQQKNLDEATIAALGKVGSLKAVSFLAEIARSAAEEQRVKALQALSSFPDKSLVPTAKALAADKTIAGEVRDEAFTLLEQIKDPSALDALLEFATDKQEKIRYRAVEGVLDGFGVKALPKLLETLSQGYTYPKDDLKDFVEDDIIKLGAEALPSLRKALSSTSWIARLIAVRVLARLGTAEDAAGLEKLVGDQTKVRGWGSETVGSEAKAALEKIRGRRR